MGDTHRTGGTRVLCAVLGAHGVLVMRKWCLWGGAAPQKSAAEPAYQGGWHSMLSAGGGAPQITDPVLGAGGRGPAPRIQCLGGGSAPQTRYPAAITPSPFGGGGCCPMGGVCPPSPSHGGADGPPPPSRVEQRGVVLSLEQTQRQGEGHRLPPPAPGPDTVLNLSLGGHQLQQRGALGGGDAGGTDTER